MNRWLPDVNVLVALFDPDHVHHDTAHAWLEDRAGDGIAFCPFTENGVVRVMSRSGYPNGPYRPLEIGRLLSAWKSNLVGRCLDWPCALSIGDPRHFDLGQIASGRHIADAYLLGIAVQNGGRPVTFDRTIPWRAVPGADGDSLKVLR